MKFENIIERWSQKTKILFVHKLTGQAVWMIGGSFSQAFIAFASNLILARLLLPEDFGKFALIQANVSLVNVILSFKFGSLLLRNSAKKIDKKYLSICVGGLALQTLLVAVGTFIILRLWGLLNLESTILLTSLILSNWTSIQISLYERKFNYKNMSWIETTSLLVAHCTVVIGALLGLGAIVLYLREIIRILCLAGGLCYIKAWQKLPIRWLKTDEWKLLFEEVRGFWTDGVLEQLFNRLIILLLGNLAGQQATGYFFQARRLAIIPHQFLQPLTHRIAFNYFSHKVNRENRVSQILKSLGATFVILGCAAIFNILFANKLIPVVFGEKWEPVVPLVIALTGFMIGFTLFNLLKTYFMAQFQMRNFLLIGRGSQYLAILVTIIAISISNIDPVLSISIGLSSSYIVGTICCVAVLLAKNKKTHKLCLHEK